MLVQVLLVAHPPIRHCSLPISLVLKLPEALARLTGVSRFRVALEIGLVTLDRALLGGLLPGRLVLFLEPGELPPRCTGIATGGVFLKEEAEMTLIARSLGRVPLVWLGEGVEAGSSLSGELAFRMYFQEMLVGCRRIRRPSLLPVLLFATHQEENQDKQQGEETPLENHGAPPTRVPEIYRAGSSLEDFSTLPWYLAGFSAHSSPQHGYGRPAIAAADRSTSSAIVGQLDTEIRIATAGRAPDPVERIPLVAPPAGASFV